MAIIKFNNDEELKQFLKTKSFQRKTFSGSEGTCFFSPTDSLAYKIFDFPKELDVKKIITTETIDLPSFAFSIDIFTVNGQVRGYTAPFIKPDLFSMDGVFDLDTFTQLDFIALKKALLSFKKDTLILSQNHIRMYDLFANLIYTGQKLVAIDTLEYEFDNRTDLAKFNNECITYAFARLFGIVIDNRNLDETLDPLDYLDEIAKIQKVYKR